MPVAEITENSRVPFGRRPEKGKRLRECSDSFLRWIMEHMKDTDFHLWAFHAEKILAQRELHPKFVIEENLDTATDEFLRNHGYGKLAKRH